MTDAIYDYAAIRKAMEERGADTWLRCDPSGDAGAVSPEPTCSHCEGGGWEAYSIGVGDPHFRECPECHNPEDHPCP